MQIFEQKESYEDENHNLNEGLVNWNIKEAQKNDYPK